MEKDKYEKQLKTEGLKIHDIAADGNCMYGAVAHQMLTLFNKKYSVPMLRDMCADRLRQKEEEMMIFYVPDEESSSWEDFIDKIRNTAMWGGNLELIGLAK